MAWDKSEIEALYEQKNNASTETPFTVTRTSNNASSANTKYENFQVNWNKEAECKIDLPDIHASISASALDQLKRYQKRDELYTYASVGSLVIMVICFIALFVIAFADAIDNDYFIYFVPGVFGMLPFSLLFDKLGKKNAKAANTLFKNELVIEELKYYIDNPRLLDHTETFVKCKTTDMHAIDLFKCDSPMMAVSTLGLGDDSCNENSINEWISGNYHDTPFLFFEANFMKAWTTRSGSGNNRKTVHHQIKFFDGQGYIFKTSMNMPFAIQYDFIPGNTELTIENFDKLFMAYRYYAHRSIYSVNLAMLKNVNLCDHLAMKDTLSPDERQVFDAIEAREFKTCLIKLAQLLTMPSNDALDKDQIDALNLMTAFGDEYVNQALRTQRRFNRWSVRLDGHYLIILRDGGFNYFEFNIDKRFDNEVAKFSREMTEFVSVLETLSSLSIVQGANKTA